MHMWSQIRQKLFVGLESISPPRPLSALLTIFQVIDSYHTDNYPQRNPPESIMTTEQKTSDLEQLQREYRHMEANRKGEC